MDGDPGGAFYEQLLAALYPNSPDGRPTIGSEDEIAALTRDKAMAFYRAHYAPNNAILVVAGDVEADEVRQLAERHFGPIPASTLAARPERPPEPPRQAAALGSRSHDARVPAAPAHPALSRAARRAGDQEEAAALVVLADLLGGPRVTSIMARELVGAGRHRPRRRAPPIPPPGLGQQEFGTLRGAEARASTEPRPRPRSTR